MSAPPTSARPDKVLTDIADYVAGFRIDSDEAYTTAQYCLIDTLGCGFEALTYPACTKLLGPVVPGNRRPERREGAGHVVPARSREGGVRPRRDHPLARLQRHLARGRMGAPVGQPRRHPDDRRLAVAHRGRRRQGAAYDARRADGDDQGARDPGRARAGEQLQPRRSRSRRAGEGRVDRRRRAHARAVARRDRQRGVARLGRRSGAAHLPSCAQHRLAQELGGGRRHVARRAARADREDRRDGLPVGAHREDLGLLRRPVQGQCRSGSSGLTAAT